MYLHTYIHVYTKYMQITHVRVPIHTIKSVPYLPISDCDVMIIIIQIISRPTDYLSMTTSMYMYNNA